MKRRGFLKSAGITVASVPFWMGLLPENLWAKIPAGIKITEVKTFLVENKVYVKICTNKGVTGLGEGSRTGMEHSVEAHIRDRTHILIGEDPTNIEFLWQAMFRWPRTRGGLANHAISAIDIALWDILGKLLDAPVYKLLGGAARDRVRLYCHGTRKIEGFTAYRTSIAPDDLLKRPWNLSNAVVKIRKMREAVGDDCDIIVDAHNRMTPVQALEFANAVESYRLMFLEDPVLPENLAGLEWIGNHTNVPLGIGESNYTKLGFKDIIYRHLVNYVRPDVACAGGISELKKIGAMAEANFIDVALHAGPSPVSNLASTHVAACTPNCVIQECSGLPTRREQWEVDMFYGDDISITDGYAALPEKPGLGCDLDEKVAAAHPYTEQHLPYNRYEDGSVSDW